MSTVQTVLLLVAVAVAATAAWLYAPDKDRTALEAEYAAPPDVFVEAAGLRLHVRDSGPKDAPALLLLHGFGSSLHTWEDWAQALSSKYRVIRFDLPGFGLTGPDPAGDYSDARGMQVLAALLDALGVNRATLIGNSLGGKLAWLFASAHPDRVDKLVLVSPDGFASRGFEYGKAPSVPWFLRLLPYVFPAPLVRMSLAPAYANPGALTTAMVRRYRDLMLAPGVRRSMIARMEQVRLEPPEPLLRRIQAPTLLLWGERDGMIPFGNASDYLKAVPGSRLVALPALGHVPQEEDPAGSLAPLQAFLQQR